LEIGAIPDSITCICTKHFLWHLAKDSSLSTRFVPTKVSIPQKILDGVRELRLAYDDADQTVIVPATKPIVT
jgi:hypothetical protein